MSTPQIPAQTVTLPAPSNQEAQNLAGIVQEWRRIHEEIAQHKQAASEKKKRAKVLEAIILNIMKQNNMGALDLKSGGRIVYEKKNVKGSFNMGSLQKMLSEHMKDEAKAAEAVKFMIEHREQREKDKLSFEKF